MDLMSEQANNSGVRFEIFEQMFSLDGDDLDYDHILKLAEYVDAKMREIADKTPGADSTRLAMIAALEIADDYHLLKTKLDEEKSRKRSSKSLTEEDRQRVRERRQRHHTKHWYEQQPLAIMKDESVPAKERRGALFALGRSRGYQRQPTGKR